MRKLTRRFLVSTLDELNLSNPILYERYYLDDGTRIQNRGGKFEKEVLDESDEIVERAKISEDKFLRFREQANAVIVRKSYLFLDDDRVSIKEYLGDYASLIRAEVKFKSIEEQEAFKPYPWMICEITDSPLAFDSQLHRLSKHEFKEKLTGIKKRDA